MTTPDTDAVLLLNTGTPSQPQALAVARFLRRFLSDQRVVELPAALWLPLLYGIILPFRSPRSAQKYREIWTPLGSPLQVNCDALSVALGRQLGVRVEMAYLYSEPGVAAAMEKLHTASIRHLTVLPLFPQSSGTTTGACVDQVGRALRRWRVHPDMTWINRYGEEPGLIDALANKVHTHASDTGTSPRHLLMSFHGIPQRCVRKGDTYEAECKATAGALAARLGLAPAAWTLSFQSRFGSERWLGPATDQLLQQMPGRGIVDVDVVCPGFACDCLETLEEIAITARATFLAAGGHSLRYIPALNADPAHAQFLAQLVRHRTAGHD